MDLAGRENEKTTKAWGNLAKFRPTKSPGRWANHEILESFEGMSLKSLKDSIL